MILTVQPVWQFLAIELGVPVDRVQAYRTNPFGGLLALQYWRDGRSGQSFPSTWRFLLKNVEDTFGKDVAKDLEEKAFKEPTWSIRKYLCTYSLHVLVYILITCICLHTHCIYILGSILTTCTCLHTHYMYLLHTHYMYLSTYSLHVLVYIFTTCTCLHTHYMYLSTYSLHVLVYILLHVQWDPYNPAP